MMKKLVVVFVAMFILALSSMACGGSDNATPVSVAVGSVPTTYDKAASAKAQGQWVIRLDGSLRDGARAGVFVGLNDQLCTLAIGKEYRLETTLNLRLRVRDAGDDEDWYTITNLDPIVGDYIVVTMDQGVLDGVTTIQAP